MRITHRSAPANSRSPASGTVYERVFRLVFRSMCAWFSGGVLSIHEKYSRRYEFWM